MTPSNPSVDAPFLTASFPAFGFNQTSQLTRQTGGSLLKWIPSNSVSAEAVDMMSFVRECLKARGTAFR